MIKQLYILLLALLIFSCAPKVKYIKVQYTTPPAHYYPTTNELTTIHELLFEYRNAIMKISEWEDREFLNNTNYRIIDTNSVGGSH